jgi:hypothetical protein
MGGSEAAASGSGWVRQSVWALGTVLASVVLGGVCIMVGAIAAMAFEYGMPRSVGIAINWAALALMIGCYCVLVVTILRVLVSRRSVPFSVWPALGVYPLVWGMLVVSSPGGPYEITVVTGIGAVAAWLMVGRSSAPSAAPLNQPSPPG